MATGFDVGGFRFAQYGNPGPQQVPGHAQEWFGGADINAAIDQHASPFQLMQLLDRAQREHGQQVSAGWTGPGGRDPHGRFAIGIGQAAHNRISRISAPHNWTYENQGGYGFELADIAAVGDNYQNLDKIRELRNFASQHGLSIGSGVTERISSLDAEARDARTMEFQRQLADEQAERDRLAQEQERVWQADMLAQQQAAAAEQARIQEAAAAQAARVKGSSPTGVGNAATIKGSRLSITEAGGSRGTKRFTRPGTQYLNTLGIGGAAAPTGQSTLNL